MRLVNGTVPSRGKVEVLYGGDCRPVYSYGWDLQEANVVCRQLGYNGAKVAADDQVFIEQRCTTCKRIMLDNVHCDGNEMLITECRHSGLGVCLHGITTSVVCNSEGIIFNVI